MIKDETVDALENLFLSLSDKTRLRLLSLMADEEVSVGYLADSLGESQPKISRHLAYLRNAGLVATRRDGRWIYYAIDTPRDPVAANVLEAAIGRRPIEKPRIRAELDVSPTVNAEPELEYSADTSHEQEPETYAEPREELEIFLL